MKRIFKKSIYTASLLLGSALMSSCLTEFNPTDQATQEQVNKEDKTSLVNAIPAYLNSYNSDAAWDIGFMGLGIWRDATTCDYPVYDSTYSYYYFVEMCVWLGSEWSTQYTIWERYYGLIQKTNLVLNAIDVENNPADAAPAVTALAYRANAYLEMAQWYEYKMTGIAGLDDQAVANEVIGLTVPIVTEKTTEADSRHNPRVPFYQMYRFILTDLNRAESYGAGSDEPASKTYAGLGVVYGLQARLWLLLGTRFDMHPDDMATALSHEGDADMDLDRLGVSSARECYVKAAEYARKAINRGYRPLNEAQWFDPKSGFNTVNASWMWANVISTDNGLASSLTWQSFVSYNSPEATYGISTPNYGCYRMIDSRLYGKISDGDWRKTTWIDPDDVGDQTAYNTKYAKGTSLGYNDWKQYQAYTAFKFHPANGDGTASTVGNAVSMPLMRVEEMYLIEAEAVGRSQGEAAGRQLLETFMNSYRMSAGATYKSTGEGLEGFIDDVFNQKRIELWGEGLILWDFRRLEKPITRGYPGTNWPTIHRYNSLPGYVAPWSTLCIPLNEKNMNESVKLNPDPSHDPWYKLWTE